LADGGGDLRIIWRVSHLRRRRKGSLQRGYGLADDGAGMLSCGIRGNLVFYALPQTETGAAWDVISFFSRFFSLFFFFFAKVESGEQRADADADGIGGRVRVPA